MGVKFDLEETETFGQGVRAFRIIPAASIGDADAAIAIPEAAKTPSDNATRLGEALLERQHRARQNRVVSEV